MSSNSPEIASIRPNTIASSCDHSCHLLLHPTCKNQTCLKKIANIAFHILTLGTVLIIAQVIRIIACCFTRKPSALVHINLQAKGIASVEKGRTNSSGLESVTGVTSDTPDAADSVEPSGLESEPERKEGAEGVPFTISLTTYPSKALEALEFARHQLTRSDVSHTSFTSLIAKKELYQPIDEEICRLHTLYHEHLNAFTKALEECANKSDKKKILTGTDLARHSWKHQDVIATADLLIKIAYVISVRTLTNLETFTKYLSDNGQEGTFAKTLTRKDSYACQTFFYFTTTYHMVRSLTCYWKKKLILPKTPSGFADFFYIEGTLPNSWRGLYNDYCARIRLYVSDEELNRFDKRHVEWTQPDTEPATFKARPTTVPVL